MEDKSEPPETRNHHANGCESSGFRVSGFWVRVQGSGFRDQGSGFRVFSGFGVRVNSNPETIQVVVSTALMLPAVLLWAHVVDGGGAIGAP